MSLEIELRVPKRLEPRCNGQSSLTLTGDTVLALLAAVEEEYPALYQCICDETGQLRKHIHVFVNNDILTTIEACQRPVQSGDVVSIFQAVSGG